MQSSGFQASLLPVLALDASQSAAPAVALAILRLLHNLTLPAVAPSEVTLPEVTLSAAGGAPAASLAPLGISRAQLLRQITHLSGGGESETGAGWGEAKFEALEEVRAGGRGCTRPQRIRTHGALTGAFCGRRALCGCGLRSLQVGVKCDARRLRVRCSRPSACS